MKQQIGFSSNFASLLAETLYAFKKGACQSTNLVKFHKSSRKSEILHLDGLLLSKSYKCSAKKITEELSLMALKSYVKFKEKPNCGFKYDMRNLWILTQPLKSIKI